MTRGWSGAALALYNGGEGQAVSAKGEGLRGAAASEKLSGSLMSNTIVAVSPVPHAQPQQLGARTDTSRYHHGEWQATDAGDKRKRACVAQPPRTSVVRHASQVSPNQKFACSREALGLS